MAQFQYSAVSRGGEKVNGVIDAFNELDAASKEIRSMHDEYQRYMESTKVFHEAKKLLTQADNYARFGELDLRYSALAQADPAGAE